MTLGWAKEGMEGQGHFWKNPGRLNETLTQISGERL